jgi:hypothetical protein
MKLLKTTEQRFWEKVDIRGVDECWNWLAGKFDDGYGEFRLNDHMRRAHRVAWFLTYGYMPKTIDHINGNGLDNRLCNLREVTSQQNCHNQRTPPKHNTTGFMGVSYYKAGKKYSAHINLDGKKRHLGYFNDPEIAYQAYLVAKRKLHSTCSR